MLFAGRESPIDVRLPDVPICAQTGMILDILMDTLDIKSEDLWRRRT